MASNAQELVIEGSSTSGITILSATNNTGRISFGDSGDNDIGFIRYDHSANAFNFTTNASEAMRIQSDGSVHIGDTLDGSGNQAMRIDADCNATNLMVWNQRGSSAPYGPALTFTAADPDNNSEYAFIFAADGTNRMVIHSDGDVQNHDNSYGSISDERIKQNITDASSQWDDIKAVKVRKFKMKDDVRQYGDKAWEQIGVIAQELEASGMDKLVEKTNPSTADILSDSSFGTLVDDADNPIKDESGNITGYKQKVGEIKDKVKSAKYSILYMKAIKALQEAQTRIETLETKVKALEDA